MATLQPGSTVQSIITVGEVLSITGSAEVSIRPGQSEIIGGGRIGPFGTQVTATIRAISLVTYYVENIGYFPPAIVDNDGEKLLGFVDPAGTETIIPKVFGSAIPFIMVASGNITSTAGNITTGTAHDYAVGPSYVYFPANALNATSAAGWYYTNWTAATLGVVYADTYTNGVPTIPANPLPLTTVVAAYTQVTGFDAVGPNYTIPGGALGNNGTVEWGRVINSNNSAGAKTFNIFYGGTTFQGTAQTTNPKEAGMGVLRNRGIETRQIGVNAAHGDSGNASTLPKLTIDSRTDQIFSFALQLATATDYAMIEAHSIRYNRVD